MNKLNIWFRCHPAFQSTYKLSSISSGVVVCPEVNNSHLARVEGRKEMTNHWTFVWTGNIRKKRKSANLVEYYKVQFHKCVDVEPVTIRQRTCTIAHNNMYVMVDGDTSCTLSSGINTYIFGWLWLPTSGSRLTTMTGTYQWCLTATYRGGDRNTKSSERLRLCAASSSEILFYTSTIIRVDEPGEDVVKWSKQRRPRTTSMLWIISPRDRKKRQRRETQTGILFYW